MTKADIIKAAAKAAGVTQATAEAIINAAIEAAAEALVNGDPVKIHNYGIFDRRQRAARTTRDFKTGEPITTAAAMTIHFKPAEELKRGASKYP